jgi:hypothetical protein
MADAAVAEMRWDYGVEGKEFWDRNPPRRARDAIARDETRHHPEVTPA